MKIYAGIGAQETPQDYLDLMTHIAEDLGTSWLLRSGGAKGADTAFSRGAANKEIHLPWNSYNNLWAGRDGAFVPSTSLMITEITARFHPNWVNLNSTIKSFMERNTTIVLGENLDQHVKMVICWTPGGRMVGGTSHAMRIAFHYDIPVFNLAIKEDIIRLINFEKGMK